MERNLNEFKPIKKTFTVGKSGEKYKRRETHAKTLEMVESESKSLKQTGKSKGAILQLKTKAKAKTKTQRGEEDNYSASGSIIES